MRPPPALSSSSSADSVGAGNGRELTAEESGILERWQARNRRLEPGGEESVASSDSDVETIGSTEAVVPVPSSGSGTDIEETLASLPDSAFDFAGTSLLQTGLHRSPSLLHETLSQPDTGILTAMGTVRIDISAAITVADVTSQLVLLGLDAGASDVVPLYPVPDAGPRFLLKASHPDATTVALRFPGSFLCTHTILEGTSVAEVCARISKAATCLFAGHCLSRLLGFFSGMVLDVIGLPVAQWETTPILSGAQGVQGGARAPMLQDDPAWNSIDDDGCRRVFSDAFPSRTPEVVLPKVVTGLDPDMMDFAFGEFDVHFLCKDVSSLGSLHAATVAALQLCPIWRGQPFSGIRIYSDGSFNPKGGAAGWAVCALVLCGHRWHFAGYASDCLHEVGHPHHLGIDHHSAHVAELVAMAAVAGLVGSLPVVPIEVCFDALSAAGIAEGRYWSRTIDSFSMTVTTLMHLAQLRVGAITWKHIRSHSGDPFNELVDTAAKAASVGTFAAPIAAAHLAMLFHSPELAHVWWLRGWTGLPPVNM